MMEWTRTGIFITLLVVVCACTQKNKTVTDAEPDRPEAFANDDELLDYIQKTHFNYMWEGAEKTSGLACERIHLDNVYPQQDQDVITIGGSGFGIAGLLVAIERNFINREEGVARLTKIVDYLAKADQYQDDQNPINSLQGSSSSFFCVLSMAEQSPREPVFHTSFYTITKSFFCTQI
jgi:hypothetical protein